MDDLVDTYQRLQYKLIAFASGIVGNKEEAQEIVSEVFFECLKKNEVDVSKAYLYKSVRNRSLNRKRSLARYLKGVERFAQYVVDLISLGDESELKSELHLKIDGLPPHLRQVLYLRLHDELRVSEIASILELPEGTIKSRINTATKKLREEMNGKSGDQ